VTEREDPDKTGPQGGSTRRELLATTAVAVVGLIAAPPRDAAARSYSGGLPWTPGEGQYPEVVQPVPWTFFTPAEGAAVEAIVDRLVPADNLSPGGKDAGCAVFIDRQLAGPFGRAQGLYMRGPFAEGLPQQGLQSPTTPAERYRSALAALDRYCQQQQGGKAFAALSPEQQDQILHGIEDGHVQLPETDGTAFFELVLQNTMEGFFADPIHGGNRDMVAWKMLGFPGARYDYRAFIGNYNKPFPLPPVSINGRPEWSRRT
jgi:gluconate 2-dehydrogenase gamma chain